MLGKRWKEKIGAGSGVVVVQNDLHSSGTKVLDGDEEEQMNRETDQLWAES